MRRKTAVSFTGGKDSTLTIHLLSQPPEGCDDDLSRRLAKCGDCEICLLVTFVPSGGVPDFKAHPIDVMKLQAEAMGIKHITLDIDAPYLESYNANIRKLKDEYGVTVLATGDMMDVSNGFMQKAVNETGVELLTPLWEMERGRVLDLIWHYKIQSFVTCINITKFGTPKEGIASSEGVCTSTEKTVSDNTNSFEIRSFLGKALSPDLVEAVLQPAKIQYGVDICGEHGEYHTMSCDGLLFSRKVQLSFEYSSEKEYHFLRMQSAYLTAK